jgi:Heterokaryon incompatibility protein (HET)
MGLLLTDIPPYEYTPFQRPRQIRVIDLYAREDSHLQCTMRIVDLDDAPPFTALSYTHGPPIAYAEGDRDHNQSHKPLPLICEGRTLSINQNLASALSQIEQLGKHGYYWIDQVSINQQDTPEVQDQVTMMGDIYYAAKKVLIWLGEEADDSGIVVTFIEEVLPKAEDFTRRNGGVFPYSFENPQIYGILGIPLVPQIVWDGLQSFFKRRYFGRVWTFQEALLARKIEILCGATRISWNRLGALLKFLRNSAAYVLMADEHKILPQKGESPQENPELGINPMSGLASTMKLRKKTFFTMDPDYQTYLGNIAQGSDNVDLILGFIDLLLYQMRFKSATNPRDYFFCIYGVVSRLCKIPQPELPNPLISPNYKKTATEVYTANIKSLISHSKSLLLLSSVDDRSLGRRTDLPSWVPDMERPIPHPFPYYATGDIFDASKGALSQILLAPNIETLSLVGYRIDIVTELGDNQCPHARNGVPFEKSATLLLSMPTIYITDQDRMEVFWRTMLANMSNDDLYPAPTTLKKAFHTYLLMNNATLLREAQARGPLEYEAALQRMNPLLTLASSTPEAATTIPSLEEILQRKSLHDFLHQLKAKKQAALEPTDAAATDDQKPSPSWETLEHMLAEEADEDGLFVQMARVKAARILFRTEHCLLGMGPHSTRPGDHVFVLPGARVPFVLRPVGPAGSEGGEDGQDGENGGNGSTNRFRYEMVGEAYIHGIMHGEALRLGLGSREPEKMEIDLV